MTKKLLTLLLAVGLCTAAQQAQASVASVSTVSGKVESKAVLPFATTTIVNGEFAPTTTWYAIRMTSSGFVLTHNGAADCIELATVTTKYDDADLWCFVGDATSGFSIYNKSVGASKRLASPKSMTGDSGGTAYPVMKADGDANYVYLWNQTAAGNNAYYFNQQGNETYILNNRGGKLAFWTTGKDAGSTIRCEVGTAQINVCAAPAEIAKGELNLQLALSGKCACACSADKGISLPGADKGKNYTLTAPENYVITGYSFDFISSEKKKSVVINATGKAVKAKYNKAKHIAVSGLDTAVVTLNVKGECAANIKNFVVHVKHDYIEPEPQQNLYITNAQSARPYRIPAIAAAPNGDVFAISDYRPCGNDIGYGEVDIKCRISKDNGKTWGEEFYVADGKGGDANHMTTGYGDAAIVADREQNKLLVMMVCGRTVCWHGRWRPSKIGDAYADSVNRVANIYLTYNEATGEWEKSEIKELTDHIYSLFLDGETPTVSSMFIGSGKICQSRRIKVGDYYRLYCSMWTRDGGNRVIYSDDFGASWKVLGTIKDRPAPGGDEPKVEELPDGSVLLSSRCTGRYFNIYTYSNAATGEGEWATVALSNADNNGVAAVSNSTNGEILIVPVVRKADGVKTHLALQSVPFGPGRANVGIFYKELTSRATDYATPTLFAADWDGSHQSSTMGSAYTTMTLQKDNSIGFLYEESTFGRDYTIVYKNYTIDYITDGQYEYCE